MAKEETLRVNILADKSKLESGLSSAESRMNSFASSAKKIFGGLVAALGIRQIIRSGNEATKAADAQIQAQQSLLVALNNNVSAQRRLIAQAGELQKITMFGDESTIEAQRQLAVLGLTEQQIKKLIPAIQDMATGLRMDLVSASSLVGKSITTTTDALARYFGTGLDGVIGQSERAAVLTENLTKKFEGQAQAAAQVGRGPLVQLKNAWGDYQEVIGAKVLPALTKFANFGTVILQSMSKQSTALMNERTELNLLIGAITSELTKREDRLSYIKKLQQEYPDFLGNLNAEKVNNEQLLGRLQEVNQEYEKKISIAIKEELIAKRTRELTKLYEDQYKAQKELARLQIDSKNLMVAYMKEQKMSIEEIANPYQDLINTQKNRITKIQEERDAIYTEVASITELVNAEKSLLTTNNNYNGSQNETIKLTEEQIKLIKERKELYKEEQDILSKQISGDISKYQPKKEEKLFDYEAYGDELAEGTRKILDGLISADEEWIKKSDENTKNFADLMMQRINIIQDVSNVMRSAMEDAVTGIAESFGNLLTGTGFFAQNMSQMIADLAKNIGRAFIGIGMGYMAIPGMQGQGAQLIAAGGLLTMMGQIGSNLIAKDQEAYQQRISDRQQAGTQELTVAKIDNRYIYLSSQRGQNQMKQIT